MADLEMFDLTGRVAIVTGGGHGIGRAIALGLARAGADVAVIDTVEGRAQGTAEELRQMGRRTLAATGDGASARRPRGSWSAWWRSWGGWTSW